MKNFRFRGFSAFVGVIVALFFFTACWEEIHPGTYYTFSGKTVASDLAENPDYSEFVKVLQRAGIWNDLSTYGNNTCFAPNNDAIARFLEEREQFARKQGIDATYLTVDDLPKEDCDTLAWTHLLDITCYIGDLTPGLLPKVNLNDRFLILTMDSTHVEQEGESMVALQRRLNNAVIVAKDDSCENGVVHFIDRCIDFGGNYVYDLVDNDPRTLLFSQALKDCGFHTILSEWYDYTYTIGEDSVRGSVKLTQAGNEWTLHYWEKRKTCFTLLVPTDSIFNKHGIFTVDDMFNYAKNIYNEYNDVDSIMSDRSNPKNPLFRFLSYHILPFLMDLSRINGRFEVMETHSKFDTDPEDYFTTYLPNSIMRISTQIVNKKFGNVYINRRDKEGNGTTGFKGPKVTGVRILPSQEMEEMGVAQYSALNGVYHYVDDILTYDSEVREDVLDRRMRIDCSTLSPDFITSGARQFDASNTGSSNYSYGFKNPKNFASYNQDYRMQVRSASASGSYAYEGDGVDIQGQFDMYVKLPAVPHNGTWQLRLSFRANSHCGIIQNYIACVAPGKEVERTDWKPLGIPVDLRVNMTDASVGWIQDSDLEDEAAVIALDKSMKNRGWMKGSIVQTTNGGTPHRDVNTMGRLTLMTDYIQSNMDYYIRIKQILDSKDGEFLFDFIEWVPKSVYDNNEDRN